MEWLGDDDEDEEEKEEDKGGRVEDEAVTVRSD